MRPLHGVLVLDKPTGVSSAQAVEEVKRALRAERAGHGGTLDPLATGVLPICLGAATKLAQYLLADDKAYEAEGVLGIETDTLDRSGAVTAERPVDVTEDALRQVLVTLTGEIDQLPPIYSAIKQGGVRMYERARAGEAVERTTRRVRIDRLALLAFAPPRFRIAIACSKGTYVRSIVADIGSALGCGAHLAELRRTQSGRFALDVAIARERLRDLDPARALIPVSELTGFPQATVPDELVKTVIAGVQHPLETFGEPAQAPRFQLVDTQGRLIAVAHGEAGRVVYDRVFPELVRA